MSDRNTNYKPTKEEIRRACESIQSKWNDSEKQRRECYAAKQWAVPKMDVAGLQLELAD